MYNDVDLNIVNNQLVVVEDVPEVSESFKAALDKEKEMVPSFENPLEEQQISTEQKNEVTVQGKSKPKVKF